MPFSSWLYAPVLFLLWLIVLHTAKSFLFRALRKWDSKTHKSTGEFLAKSLKLPLNVLIFGGGLALLAKLLPLPAGVDQSLVMTAKVAAVIALFFFFDRLIVRLLSRLADKIQAIDLDRGIVQGLVRLAVLSLGLLIVLDALGISITPLIASLGIGSLAVALGIQETFANLFAGVYIVAEKPVRYGDFIRLETGEEGYVEEIGWRNTRIRMLSNNMVIVPNNKIISTTIRNYYLPTKEIAMGVEVSVQYTADLERIERITLEVAREVMKKTKGSVAGSEPAVRFHTFGESGIQFTVGLRVQEFTDQYLLKHEFIKALHDRYQKEGIVIPFPTRTLELPAKAFEELGPSFPKRS